MKSEIAEPYCYWTPDEGASHASVLIMRNIFIGIALLAVLWIIGAIIVSKTYADLNYVGG